MRSDRCRESRPRLKHRALGVVAGALVLVAVGCSSGADAPLATDDSESTTTAAAATSTTAADASAALAEGDRYVALGSSIASGFGISVQSTACGRSSRNYPNLIAEQYGLELTDVSCGGATTAHVVDTPQGDNPPQLAALTPDAELVTVSIGGNDIVYNGTALACGDPANVCTAPVGLDDQLAALRTALPVMLTEIRAAAPDATVVFVANPREVPEGNCEALGFTDDEAAIIRSMGEELEAVFVEVVEPAEDVVFVDPYPEPGDHTVCASDPADRWTDGKVAADGFAYHPTALGHEQMAAMIISALER